MDALFYILSQSVYLFLSAFMMLLLVRALLSFFADEESKVLAFCYAITEPVVSPVRGLLSLVPALADSPIDFSFMATCLLIILVQSALPL